MTWKDAFVRAGVACPAYINEKIGLYPAVFFRYRKPDPVAVERQHKEFGSCSGDPEKLINSMRSFVSTWIDTWKLDAPCDSKHVGMLSHPLLLKFYFIILQSDPSAEIPAEFLEPGETGSAEGEQKK